MMRDGKNNVAAIIQRLLIMLIVLSAFECTAQSVLAPYKSYGLAIDSLNVIQNKEHLDDFYESLYQLQRGVDKKVNIIHLGDSHIQADFLTKAVRNSFQKYFGNGGRGLIVPGHVAGTNEPFNIQTSSNVTWEAKRCIYPEQILPIGIGGITIRSGIPSSRLYVYMNDAEQDYSFQTIKLFHLKDATSFALTLKDEEFKPFDIKPKADTIQNFSSFELPTVTNSIVFESTKVDSVQNHTTIFGLSLENKNPGVLYHVIGVNGAKYTHYNAAKYFASQTTRLNPELIIISLGTNESLDYPYIDKRFASHVENLVSTLRVNNPLTKFIIVTPPDCFVKKSRKNPGVAKVREALIQFAVENGLAFYDMYQALGGDNSAIAWRQAQLLRADGVHYTKEGYAYQGNLLFEAIIKGYNAYVPVRHP